MSKVRRAILDSCVLFPFVLRDFLLRLAESGLFHPHWSEAIHREWMGAVSARYPDADPAKLERTRKLMDAAFPDALVEAFNPLPANIDLPDANDRHVVAAAIAAGAGIIVTLNMRDFPDSALNQLGIAAMHPDDFALALMADSAHEVIGAAERARLALTRPALSTADYAAGLTASGLPRTAARLRVA